MRSKRHLLNKILLVFLVVVSALLLKELIDLWVGDSVERIVTHIIIGSALSVITVNYYDKKQAEKRGRLIVKRLAQKDREVDDND